MHIDYHRWYSNDLGQDMELKVYGHGGKPVIGFPAQGGRFWDLEDFGIVNTIGDHIEAGRLTLFCVDSVDSQSWFDQGKSAVDKALRHSAFQQYILNDVVPLARGHVGNHDARFLATGCSMGGYHAADIVLRYPTVFDSMLAISGVYSTKSMIGDEMPEPVYFHSPIEYMTNLSDGYYLDALRAADIVVVVGQGPWEDECLRDTRALGDALHSKGIPAFIDIWGHDVNHDWPWWHKMIDHHIERFL